MNFRRVPIALGAMAVAAMMVQMVYPFSSRYPLIASGLFAFAGMTSLRHVRLPSNAVVFTGVALAFLTSAYLTGMSYQVVLMDCLWLVTGGVVGFMAVAVTDDWENWNWFRTDLTRLLFVVGFIGALLGLVKLGLAGIGILLPMFRDDFGRYVQGTSTTPEYNTYTYAMAITLACAFWIKRSDKSRVMVTLAELSIPLVVMALLLAGSRRSVLFLLSGLLGLIIVRLRHWAEGGKSEAAVVRPWRYTYLLYAVGLAGVLLVMPPSVWEDLEDVVASVEVESAIERTSSAFEEEAFESRLPLFDHAIDTIAGTPPIQLVFGAGFDYLGEFAGIFSASQLELYPHNFLLSAMMYGGILQSALLVGCIFQTFVAIWRARPVFGPMGYIMVVGVIFSAVSSNSFFSMPISTFFLIFLAHPIQREMWLRGTVDARPSGGGPTGGRALQKPLPVPGLAAA